MPIFRRYALRHDGTTKQWSAFLNCQWQQPIVNVSLIKYQMFDCLYYPSGMAGSNSEFNFLTKEWFSAFLVFSFNMKNSDEMPKPQPQPQQNDVFQLWWRYWRGLHADSIIPLINHLISSFEIDLNWPYGHTTWNKRPITGTLMRQLLPGPTIPFSLKMLKIFSPDKNKGSYFAQAALPFWDVDHTGSNSIMRWMFNTKWLSDVAERGTLITFW